MRRLLIIVVLLALLLARKVDAAISVGVTGSTNWTFDAAPASAEWSTLSIGTGSSTITTPAQLDAAVQLLSAAGITNALSVSVTYPPGENDLARWNSNRQLLETRPAGNAFTVLMATLRNDSGANRPFLTVFYDLDAVTGGLTGPEPVRGHRAYFSRTGAAGSWQLIPELSIDFPGVAAVNLNLSSWPAGSLLYLIWADDNATTETDGAYTIDNFNVRTVTGDGPVLEIVKPVSGATFTQGATISLGAYSRFFGTMTNCAFFAEGVLVSTDNAPRFGTTANAAYVNAAAGFPRLTAVARNSAGQSITSAVVQITVNVQTAPTPKLSIVLVNEFVTQVTWPLSSTGYMLESKSSLGGSAWVPVEEPDNQFGGLHHVYVSVFDPVTFFRLTKP